MNKKILIICLIAVIAVSVLCLSACNDNNAAETLRKINTAMMYDYSNITLNVKTSTDNVDLSAKYTIKTTDDITEVSYEVERLNGFDENGNVPSEFKSTVKGTATVSDGKIISVDGDQLDSNIVLDIVDTNMTFRLSYLQVTKASDDGISAKVVNAKGFLKNESFEGEDMTVTVTLSQSYLSKINLDYSLNGADVKLEYVFVR